MTDVRNFGSYRVDLPKSSFDATEIDLKEFVLSQDVMKHDMVKLRWASRRMDKFNTLASGTPIRVKYRAVNDPRSSEFFGYITHIRPVEESQKYFDFEIFAVSVSRVFRETGQDVWTKKTAPEIVSQIARKYGLKAVVRKHGLRMPQVAQRGRSYWEVMTSLANRIGYGLTVRGTTVMFLPITSFVDSQIESAPFLTSFVGGPGSKGFAIRVESITSMSGATNEFGSFPNDQSEVISIDPVKGRVTKTKKSPGSATKRSKKTSSPFTAYSTEVAHSKADTALLADGRAERGLMAIDAEIYCAGSESLRPYAPVYLQAKDKTLSGWWIVKSVTHTIERASGKYTCQLVVSTDSLGKSAIPPRSGSRARNVGREAASGIKQVKPGSARLRELKTPKVQGKTSEGAGKWRWEAV
jgi:phage protein D